MVGTHGSHYKLLATGRLYSCLRSGGSSRGLTMAMARPNGDVGVMVIKVFSFFYVESSTRSTGNGDDNSN